MHSFWDDVPGSGSTSDVRKAAVYAKSLAAAPHAEALLTSETAWVQQCGAIAKSAVYVDPIGEGAGPFTLTDSCKANAAEVSRKEVALAGARLAKLLNDNLK